MKKITAVLLAVPVAAVVIGGAVGVAAASDHHDPVGTHPAVTQTHATQAPTVAVTAKAAVGSTARVSTVASATRTHTVTSRPQPRPTSPPASARSHAGTHDTHSYSRSYGCDGDGWHSGGNYADWHH